MQYSDHSLDILDELLQFLSGGRQVLGGDLEPLTVAVAPSERASIPPAGHLVCYCLRYVRWKGGFMYLVLAHISGNSQH